jgi:preflagellin peptidase FlaK
MVLGVASVADLLRLVFLPVLAWAAYRDVQTRRLPNLLWPPLAAVGLLALAADAVVRYPFAGYADRVFLFRVGFSILFLIPFAFAAYWFRAFGGADAKALVVLAVGFPTTPTYRLPADLVANLPPDLVAALPRLAVPLYPSLLGVGAMSALTNAVVVALVYVLWLALRNLAAGRVSTAMFVGRPTAVSVLPERHGTLLVTDGRIPRSGLDLDALRMYLRWRGCSLVELRADSDRLRDPDSVTDTHDPTDGAIHREHAAPRTGVTVYSEESEEETPDGGTTDEVTDEDATSGDEATTDPTAGWEGTGFVPAEVQRTADESESGDSASEPTETATSESTGTATSESTETTVPGSAAAGASEEPPLGDPWAAEAFLSEIDGSAYGTDPETLRAGLDTVADAERVWVSPGLPFVVPLFLGLLLAVTVGDALTLVATATGLF